MYLSIFLLLCTFIAVAGDPLPESIKDDESDVLKQNLCRSAKDSINSKNISIMKTENRTIKKLWPFFDNIYMDKNNTYFLALNQGNNKRWYELNSISEKDVKNEVTDKYNFVIVRTILDL